jgi:hypothetical protein
LPGLTTTECPSNSHLLLCLVALDLSFGGPAGTMPSQSAYLVSNAFIHRQAHNSRA